MTAETPAAARPFYRAIGPTEVRRDPPKRWLPVGERPDWREKGIDMPSILLRDPEKLPIKILLHSMYGGEMGGAEVFGRRYVFATKEGVEQLPWELALVNARLTWDECRHTEIILENMKKYGVTLGELADGYVAEGLPMGRSATAGQELARGGDTGNTANEPDMINSMAAVHNGGEGLAMNLFTALIDMGRNIGDPEFERAFDFNHADEIMHVGVGTYWVPRLTEGNVEKRREAMKAQQAFEDLIMALNMGDEVVAPQEFAL
ncbi:MAG: hypothetical protein IT304_05910 [Dehalococcoidia bacterium]|nr:hypothetical protein [Dehalococcoidia bacterium]